MGAVKMKAGGSIQAEEDKIARYSALLQQYRCAVENNGEDRREEDRIADLLDEIWYVCSEEERENLRDVLGA